MDEEEAKLEFAFGNYEGSDDGAVTDLCHTNTLSASRSASNLPTLQIILKQAVDTISLSGLTSVRWGTDFTSSTYSDEFEADTN